MKFSKEAKQAFFDAFLTYRDAGETFAGAYSRARADFNAAYKIAPNFWLFRKWYKEKVNGKEAEAAESAFKAVPDEDTEETASEEVPEDTTQEEIPEEVPEDTTQEEIPEEVPEEEADAAMSSDDYTRRLELVCKMYRTHSEASRDDICDYLLPDLCRAAEE